MRPFGTQKQLENRRKMAIALLKNKLMPVEVARLLGVERRSVRRWKAAFLKYGIKGLKARSIKGRPPQ